MKAFVTLRDAITEESVLAQPKYDRLFVIRTDASDVAMGAVLQQYDDVAKRDKAIAYASKSFNSTEKGKIAFNLHLEALEKLIKM